MDGDLLKELPDCPRNASIPEEFCDIDPSKLLLESVGRSFHGNYSCEGRNDAGWGAKSMDTSVIVYCKYTIFTIDYIFLDETFLNCVVGLRKISRPCLKECSFYFHEKFEISH